MRGPGRGEGDKEKKTVRKRGGRKWGRRNEEVKGKKAEAV